MDKSVVAQRAYQFLTEFRNEVYSQILELNAKNNGELQDGFNPVYLDDGWVSLKGYAWGFVMHYDEPARIDMTFGPDWPFTGFRTTFIGREAGDSMVWVNENRAEEMYTNARELARFGLRRLASKTGDAWIFNAQQLEPVTIDHDPYYGNNLTAQ